MTPSGPGPDDREDLPLPTYDDIEQRLLEMIAAPHWKVRRGKLVTGKDGEPVPDPVPARRARKLLEAFRRDRARLAGMPWPPHERTGPG